MTAGPAGLFFAADLGALAQPAPDTLPPVSVDAPQERARAPQRPTSRPVLREAIRPEPAPRRPRRVRPPVPATVPAAGPATPLRATDVAGVRGRDSDGPVEGYKATNSATGTKTDTPIRDIPQAVVVVPRQVIEDQKAITVPDVLRNVSGIQDNGTLGGRTQGFTIRGFDSGGQTATDGLLDNRLFGAVGSRDLVNVERVEVLKGPASVLFGQNAPGGIINFVTKRPTQTPFAATEMSGGSFGFFRSTIDASVPFAKGSDFSYRINAAYERSDTFRGYFIPSERITFAPVFQWQPSADTTVTAELYHSDQKRQFDRGIPAFGNRVAHLPFNLYLGERYDTTSSSVSDARLRLDQVINDQWSARVALRGSFGSAHSLGTNLAIEDDGRTVDRGGFYSPDRFTDYDAQAEITGRFDTGILRHTLLIGTEVDQSYRSQAGGLFDQTTTDRYNPVNSGLILNVVPNKPFFSRITEVSGYIQDQIALPYGFKFVAGGRVDRDYQSNRTAVDAAFRQRDLAFSPRVGLVWQPWEIVSLYGSYATSFVPQSGQDRLGRALQPETGQQYEGGVKLESPDKKLAATIAYFDIRRQNVATTDPIDPDFSILTGEQHSRGVEMDVSGQLTEEWRIISAFAYTDAVISKDNVYQVGNRLYNVPRYAGSLWSAYDFRTGVMKGFGFGAGIYAASQRYGDLDNSFVVPAYYRIDAAAWYNFDAFTRLQINIKNLTNQRYIAGAVDRANIYPGDPLTVIASLRTQF